MNLRDLLPWRDFVVDTRWPPEVAVAEIQKRVGQPQLFGWGETAPFVGHRAGNAFRLNLKKSALQKGRGPAVIDAVVEPSHHNGARIRVKMRLTSSLSFVLLASIVFLVLCVSGARAEMKGVNAVFLSFGLLFYSTLVAIMFVFQANKAERLLREIFARAPALPAPVETGLAYR